MVAVTSSGLVDKRWQRIRVECDEAINARMTTDPFALE
jgi:hypothetical protein